MILRTILVAFFSLPAFAAPEWIAVNKAGTGFVTESGAKFTPWGFNYFRDEQYRLLEDYWNSDKPDGWRKFERDFREMKRLGANVVRIHLQFAKFMDAPGKPNQENVARLAKVIDLAEKIGVYLDITGLGTYRLKDGQPGTTRRTRRTAGRCRPSSGKPSRRPARIARRC